MHSQGGRHLYVELKANKAKLWPDVGAFRFTDGSRGTGAKATHCTFLLFMGRHGGREAKGIRSVPKFSNWFLHASKDVFDIFQK